MSGFWTSTSFSGGGLIDIEDVTPAELFPSSPNVSSNDDGASAGKSDAKDDSPSELLDHHTDGIDRRFPRRDHPLVAVACLNPPRTNLFHGSVCGGITKAAILSTDNHRLNDTTEKKTIVKGFGHLVGNAVRSQASYRSQHEGEWPFGPNILGFLHGTTDATPTWECYEFDGIIGFRKKGSCVTSVAPGETCCQWCFRARNNFFEKCRKEVTDRADDTIPLGRVDQYLLRSPSLVGRAIKNQSRSIVLLQRKARGNRDTIARLRATEVVVPNVNADVLLRDEKQWKLDYEATMKGETDISKKDIFKILFQEMDVVRQRKIRHGNAGGHIWSALMIQFCGYIRQGNGPSSGISSSAWEFIAQVFHLPTNKTLRKHSRSDTSIPDRLCFDFDKWSSKPAKRPRSKGGKAPPPVEDVAGEDVGYDQPSDAKMPAIEAGGDVDAHGLEADSIQTSGAEDTFANSSAIAGNGKPPEAAVLATDVAGV